MCLRNRKRKKTGHTAQGVTKLDVDIDVFSQNGCKKLPSICIYYSFWISLILDNYNYYKEIFEFNLVKVLPIRLLS